MTALAPSRTAKAAQTGAAVLIVAGIVIGLPLLLIAFADAPWTWHLPSPERMAVALSWPPSTNTIKYALVITAWLIWIGLTISLARETIAQLGGRHASSDVRGPIRLLAATLVGSITATAPALAASAEPSTVVAAPAEQCETAPQDAPDSASEEAEAPGPIDSYERDADGNIVHTVVTDDTIWDLSIKYYGNPDHVDEIFHFNEGKSQPGGGQLVNKHRIWPDWKLTMPGTAPAEPEPVAPVEPEPPKEDDDQSVPETTEEPVPPTAEDEEATAPTPDSDTGTAEARPFTDRGIWFAGSFLALSVLAAAVALARRHRKQPRRTIEPKAAKPTATIEEETDLTGRLPDLEDLLERQAAAESIATPIATGLEGEDEASILDHAGHGLGLTGPGADAAARACLYTAVLNAAGVICDRAFLEQLGLDPEVLATIPEITVTTTAQNLHEAIRQRQSRYVFDDETDELYREATVAFCDNDTARAIATLLDDEDTYAIALGEWEPHWLQLEEDGTPTAGTIAEGPITGLGQCYILDAETGRDLFADLAEPDSAEDIPEPPEPEAETINQPEPSSPAAETTAPAEPAPSKDEKGTKFELQLFGTHRLTWKDNDVRFRSAACLDLVAVMALTDWELTRDELTMVVAGDAHVKQAKSRRSSTTDRLREALANLTGLPKDQFLQVDRTRAVYRLDKDLFSTDVADFDQHLDRAAEADDPEQRASELEAGLQRYVGPLGEALDEVWDLVNLRAQYRDRAYQAALDLAALREADEDLNTAAKTLERATGIYPEEPTAWRHLIDVRKRQGDTEGAAEVERRHRRLQQLVAAARTR